MMAEKKRGRPLAQSKFDVTMHVRMKGKQFEKLKKIAKELGPNEALSPAAVFRHFIDKYELGS